MSNLIFFYCFIVSYFINDLVRESDKILVELKRRQIRNDFLFFPNQRDICYSCSILASVLRFNFFLNLIFSWNFQVFCRKNLKC